MDQPCEVANPARGQLDKEKRVFPWCPRLRLRIWSREMGSASRPAPSFSLSKLRLNLVLTRGIPPAFRGGVLLLIPPTAIGSVPSLSGHIIAYTDGFQVVRVTSACYLFRYHHGPISVRLSFPTPTTSIGVWWTCGIHEASGGVAALVPSIST